MKKVHSNLFSALVMAFVFQIAFANPDLNNDTAQPNESPAPFSRSSNRSNDRSENYAGEAIKSMYTGIVSGSNSWICGPLPAGYTNASCYCEGGFCGWIQN